MRYGYSLTIRNCFQKLFTYKSTQTLSNNDIEIKDLQYVLGKSEQMKIVDEKADTNSYVNFDDRSNILHIK